MGYVYLSPMLNEDERIREASRLSRDAVGIWFMCLCWRGNQRGSSGQPDDFLPSVVVKHFMGRRRKALQALVSAGLWADGASHRGKPGYRVLAQGELWRLSAPHQSRPSIPESMRRAVYHRDGNMCLHCGATERLTLDHIYPYSLGGRDTFSNLQTLCRSCNSKKGARV